MITRTAQVICLSRPSTASATFSDDEQYRYQLDRVWDATAPRLLWIMLNPSTASELVLDPTITRCVTRAMLWGFGAVEVVNLFALRATRPAALRKHADPVGGLANDSAIAAAVARAALVIAAWGVHGELGQRCRRVAEDVVVYQGRALHAIALTRAGHPGHPLYVPFEQRPFVWWAPAGADAAAAPVLPCDAAGSPRQASLDELAPTDAATFPTPESIA